MFYGCLYFEATEVISSIPNWESKVSFRLPEFLLNNMLNIKSDNKFNIVIDNPETMTNKYLDIEVISGCYVFTTVVNTYTKLQQTLSFSQSYALSLMLQKAKERIYGW